MVYSPHPLFSLFSYSTYLFFLLSISSSPSLAVLLLICIITRPALCLFGENEAPFIRSLNTAFVSSPLAMPMCCTPSEQTLPLFVVLNQECCQNSHI